MHYAVITNGVVTALTESVGGVPFNDDDTRKAIAIPGDMEVELGMTEADLRAALAPKAVRSHHKAKPEPEPEPAKERVILRNPMAPKPESKPKR